MNGIRVLLKEKTKKVKKAKNKTAMIKSKVLRKIIECLNDQKFRHMLYWDDRAKKEFTIKFVHMNNPEAKNGSKDYLELFKELDKLSNQYAQYLKDEKYNHKCKVRCKSNLRKLCGKNALTYLGETSEGKSIHLRKYKINEFSSVKKPVLSGVESIKKCSVNEFSGGETVRFKDKLNIENLQIEQSHCLCLSKFNPVNVYVEVPNGSIYVPTVIPIVPAVIDNCCVAENKNEDKRNVALTTNNLAPTLLNNCFTIENQNKDARNAMLQRDPLIVYEHEKQMSENMVSGPIENSDLYGFKSCSSIEKNNKHELMEYRELAQSNLEIQNDGKLLSVFLKRNNEQKNEFGYPNGSDVKNTDGNNLFLGHYDLNNCNNPLVGFRNVELEANCEERNIDLKLDEKVVFPGCFGPSEVMDINTYHSFEYNDLSNSHNSFNEQQMDVNFQDTDTETNCSSYLVPSSPLDVMGNSNDLLQFGEDDSRSIYKQLLRNDPLLSSTSITTDFPNDDDKYLPSDIEDLSLDEKFFL